MEHSMKTCPKCGEEVLRSAVICKHCRSTFPFSARHPIATALLLVGIPILVIATFNEASQPLPEPTAEELAARQAEQEAFDKTEAGELCLEHPGWSKEECRALVNERIWIGMSLDMLEHVRGKFSSHNVSNYGDGHRSQYCWDGWNPGCFYDTDGDGRMEAYN